MRNRSSRDDHQERFVDWMQTQQVGCGFAQSFAKRADTGGLQPLTVTGRHLETADIVPLNELLAQACSNYEGVYIVFPDINSLDEILDLIRSFCATPSWRCDEITADPSFANEALLVGLRWFLPDQRYMNYVLGFANLPQMPRTRRAPNTTLMFRTGPPGRAPGIAFAHGVNPKADDRPSEKPPIPVHLADMPDLRPTEEHVAHLWKYTTKLKRSQLEGDPMALAAKAKVTFCLPRNARDVLADIITQSVPLGSSSMMA